MSGRGQGYRGGRGGRGGYGNSGGGNPGTKRKRQDHSRSKQVISDEEYVDEKDEESDFQNYKRLQLQVHL